MAHYSQRNHRLYQRKSKKFEPMARSKHHNRKTINETRWFIIDIEYTDGRLHQLWTKEPETALMNLQRDGTIKDYEIKEFEK